jgi:hypothetical protein
MHQFTAEAGSGGIQHDCTDFFGFRNSKEHNHNSRLSNTANVTLLYLQDLATATLPACSGFDF